MTQTGRRRMVCPAVCDVLAQSDVDNCIRVGTCDLLYVARVAWQPDHTAASTWGVLFRCTLCAVL